MNCNIFIPLLYYLPMTDNNIKNISDQNRVKLQEIVNECIDNWRKPRGLDWLYFRDDMTMKSNGRYWWGNGDWYSYHDLFSKDSGLMEFVEWKESKWRIFATERDDRKSSERQYHACTMWPMTAYDKLQYFIDNAIPTQ